MPSRRPPAGAETPPFKWKDYAPRVFQRLREQFGIDNRQAAQGQAQAEFQRAWAVAVAGLRCVGHTGPICLPMLAPAPHQRPPHPPLPAVPAVPALLCSDYLLSLTGDAALRLLGSPGKSGSVFFLSDDDRRVGAPAGGSHCRSACGCEQTRRRAGQCMLRPHSSTAHWRHEAGTAIAPPTWRAIAEPLRRFLVKTVRKEEMRLLLELIPRCLALPPSC